VAAASGGRLGAAVRLSVGVMPAVVMQGGGSLEPVLADVVRGDVSTA
jgi:hypothetical protein